MSQWQSQWQRAYRYDPAQLPRRRELEVLRDERELTAEERAELQWLVYSHTNFLLDAQRNK